jgi:hypothetical protein
VVTSKLDAGKVRAYPVVPEVSLTYKAWFPLSENEAWVNLVTSKSALSAARWRMGLAGHDPGAGLRTASVTFSGSTNTHCGGR